jgi:hypothetical protein
MIVLRNIAAFVSSLSSKKLQDVPHMHLGGFFFHVYQGLQQRRLLWFVPCSCADPWVSPRRDKWAFLRRNRRRSFDIVRMDEPEHSWWKSTMNRSGRKRVERVASEDIVAIMPSRGEGRGNPSTTTAVTTFRRDDHITTLRFCQCQQCVASEAPFIDMI